LDGFDSRLNAAWWALRIGLAFEQLVAGTDKFFNKLADWGMYLSSFAAKIIPMSPARFMHAVGIAEIVLGILLLTRWTKIGAYLVMLWLIGIAINLAITGMFYDLALRDLEVAIGAFALAQLSASRDEAVQRNQRSAISPESH
jgi:uncharacterized membrane protein YphA (DoxX/SURF4 family)